MKWTFPILASISPNASSGGAAVRRRKARNCSIPVRDLSSFDAGGQGHMKATAKPRASVVQASCSGGDPLSILGASFVPPYSILCTSHFHRSSTREACGDPAAVPRSRRLASTALGQPLFRWNPGSNSVWGRVAFAGGGGIPGRTCARGRRPWRWRTRRLHPAPPG